MVSILFTLSVFVSMQIAGANYTCYSCYYSQEHLSDAWNEPMCMNRPTDVQGVSTTVSCSDEKFCFTQGIYDVGTNRVWEFGRSCSVTGFRSECVKDTNHVVCRTSCKGALCNGDHTATTLMNNVTAVIG